MNSAGARFAESRDADVVNVASAAVSAQGLVKEYVGSSGAVRVLSGADIIVRKGETVVIMGPSGSGKSTLLYCLGALMRPTSGRVHIGNDCDPWALTDRKRSHLRSNRIGFVFQSYHLLPDLSVFENCLIACRIAGAPGDSEDIRTLLGKLGLEKQMHQRPAELSGGEAQRAAVARALVNRPQIILCDEPTGNLDSENAQRMLDIFSDIKAAGEQSVVVVTHNEQVADIADRVLRLENGLLTEDR